MTSLVLINRAPVTTETMVTMASAVIILLTVVRRTGATCNAEQKYRCRHSAEENQLESVPGSGNCIVKQYVQYTHVCTVSNYVPSIDYCCCAHRQSQIMCCRYHQDWNHFRCVESDDSINTSSQIVNISVAWQPLLFIALAVVIVGGCVLLCCMSCVCRQCRRHHYEYNEDHNKYSLYSCCDDGTSSPFDEASESKSAGVNANSYLVDRTRPQTTALLTTACPVYRHHRHSHHQLNCYVDRLPPSAPPSDASITCSVCDDRDDDRVPSQTSTTRTLWQPPPLPSSQAFSDVIVCVNENDGRPRCSACAITTSFPPPTYDESLFHCPPSSTMDGRRRSAVYQSLTPTSVTSSPSPTKEETI